MVRGGRKGKTNPAGVEAAAATSARTVTMADGKKQIGRHGPGCPRLVALPRRYPYCPQIMILDW